MKLELKPPMIITARLMAGLKIGDAYISIGYKERDSEGRMNYEVYIDLDRWGEFPITDLKSGRQGGNLQQGLASLLGFLANADSIENSFPAPVMRWAADNHDEISMLENEIEEANDIINEIPSDESQITTQ